MCGGLWGVSGGVVFYCRRYEGFYGLGEWAVMARWGLLVVGMVVLMAGCVGGVPAVTPLEWPGEPIPAKVLMIGLKDGRFLGYAVADLEERALKVYRGGHISFQVDWAQGGSITSRGDVLIKDGRVGYLVPGGDFTEPSLPVRPSRYVPERDGIAPYMGGKLHTHNGGYPGRGGSDPKLHRHSLVCLSPDLSACSRPGC